MRRNSHGILDDRTDSDLWVYLYRRKLNKIEKKTDARLKRMEDRLQLITKEMGIVDREPEINKELRQLMEEGKTVTAVKSKRSFWFSLLEAKQYVDKL